MTLKGLAVSEKSSIFVCSYTMQASRGQQCGESAPQKYSVNHITAITAATFLADNKIVKRGNVPHDITATLPQKREPHPLPLPKGEGSEMIIRSPEDGSPEVGWKSKSQKSGSGLEVQKTEVRKSSHYSEEVLEKSRRRKSRRRKSRSQKSGSPVITISKNRSFGIPGDEATSVVAGLVPATSRIAIP